MEKYDRRKKELNYWQERPLPAGISRRMKESVRVAHFVHCKFHPEPLRRRLMNGAASAHDMELHRVLERDREEERKATGIKKSSHCWAHAQGRCRKVDCTYLHPQDIGPCELIYVLKMARAKISHQTSRIRHVLTGLLAPGRPTARSCILTKRFSAVEANGAR